MPAGSIALLGALEEANRAEELHGWSTALVAGLKRATGARACQVLRVHEGGTRLEELGDPDPLAREILAAGHASLDQEQVRRLYRSGATVVSLADVHRGPPPTELERAMHEAGVGDILGLVAPPGVSVGLYLPAARPLDLRARHLWLSIARLVGVGVALRAAGNAEPHLDGDLPAQLRGAIEELDRRRREARRIRSERDASSAFAFLGALAHEGFAVVEEQRSGTRRRLVAVRPRDPAARALRTLEPGERQVLEALRRGLSIQEAAFDLGVAEATVSGRIARIRVKLGVDPRDELIHVASLHDE